MPTWKEWREAFKTLLHVIVIGAFLISAGTWVLTGIPILIAVSVDFLQAPIGFKGGALPDSLQIVTWANQVAMWVCLVSMVPLWIITREQER
jgi:hypothetical protein